MAKKPSRPIVTCNGTTVASTEIRKMIDEIHKLQDDIDKKQNKVDELKDEVIKFMAKSETESYEFLETQDKLVLAQYSRQDKETFDTTKFKKDHPKYWATYKKDSLSMRFLLK